MITKIIDFLEYDQLIPVHTAEKMKPTIPSPQRLTFDQRCEGTLLMK